MVTATSVKIELAEFKRGWRILLVSILGIITSGGVMPLYSFGPLVEPFEQSFGWSRGEVQTTITFFFIALAISSQFAGGLIHRFGLRRVAIVSLITQSAATLLLTQINQSIISLYTFYFIMTVAGLGTQQVLWTQLVGLWFVKNRGLALAIVLSGTGLCAMIITPVVTYVIQWHSWQAAIVTLAIIPLITTLPACLIWLRSTVISADTKKQTTGQRFQGLPFSTALRQFKFWIIVIGLSFVVVGILGMLTNAVPLLRDKGISPTAAAGVFSFFGLSLVLGRSVSGYLIDRLWAPGVAFITLSLPAIGCLLYGVADTNLPLLIIGTLFLGIGAGAEFDIASFLLIKYFGLLDYSRIFSLFFGISSLGLCFAPHIFGTLYDITGNYDAMLWICGSGFLLGASMLLMLGAYPEFDKAEPKPVSSSPNTDS